MSEQKISTMESRLLLIINTVLGHSNLKKLNVLEPSLKLRQDLGMDSLNLAELTVRIESECDVDIFDSGIVETISEVMSKLQGK